MLLWQPPRNMAAGPARLFLSLHFHRFLAPDWSEESSFPALGLSHWWEQFTLPIPGLGWPGTVQRTKGLGTGEGKKCAGLNKEQITTFIS